MWVSQLGHEARLSQKVDQRSTVGLVHDLDGNICAEPVAQYHAPKAASSKVLDLLQLLQSKQASKQAATGDCTAVFGCATTSSHLIWTKGDGVVREQLSQVLDGLGISFGRRPGVSTAWNVSAFAILCFAAVPFQSKKKKKKTHRASLTRVT